jgi:hypothetical protein
MSSEAKRNSKETNATSIKKSAEAVAFRGPSTEISNLKTEEVIAYDTDESFESDVSDDEEEEEEERALILAELAALKKLANDYRHPEVGVKGDYSTRCYFDRYSAPEVVSQEEAEEQAQIMADLAALKKSAVDYYHPEIGVTTSDATAMGRNYFDRPSLADDNITSSPAEDDESVHSNHFDMEEESEHHDKYEEFRAAFTYIDKKKSSDAKKSAVEKQISDEEGSLSRSPSSIFLFGMQESA